MITRYLGMAVTSKDPERLAKFYTETLGVPRLFDSDLNDPNSFDIVAIGNNINEPCIWICDADKWNNGIKGDSVLFAFKCDDHERTYEELKRKGVDLEPPARSVHHGGMELVLKDPDGNTLIIQ